MLGIGKDEMYGHVQNEKSDQTWPSIFGMQLYYLQLIHNIDRGSW